MDKEIQDMLNDLPNKKFAKLTDKQLEFTESRFGQTNPMFGKKGKDNPTYGVKKNPLSVKRMSNSLKGRPKSDEFKKMMSKVHSGKLVSEETKKKMSEAHKGKPSPTKGKKTKKIKCPYCDREIGGMGNLKQHIRKHH